MPHQNCVAITINLTSELSDYPFVLFLERRVSKSRRFGWKRFQWETWPGPDRRAQQIGSLSKSYAVLRLNISGGKEEKMQGRTCVSALGAHMGAPPTDPGVGW